MQFRHLIGSLRNSILVRFDKIIEANLLHNGARNQNKCLSSQEHPPKGWNQHVAAAAYPTITQHIPTMRHLSAILLWLLPLVAAVAQVYPSASPAMIVTGRTSSGENLVNQEVSSFDGNAPLEARFEVRPTDNEGYSARYEWRFFKDNDTKPFLTRLGVEEFTEYTFKESGSFSVKLLATFTQGTTEIEYEQDVPFAIAIAESYIEVPNAFSPNHDTINDTFHVKDNYRSIVEFHAAVYNRWMKKVYEWDDINGEWDGTSGGHDVPDGAYFLHIRAKGADGHVYNIKKTISLVRGYTETMH